MSNYIHTKEMNRQEWLEARRRIIGSSDAPSVLDLNPWSSSAEVWLEKMADEPPEDDEDNPSLFFGRRAESAIAERFEYETGLTVQQDNKIRLHEDYPYIGCNLDRMVVGKGVPLEMKKMSRFDGEIPDMYYIQIQHQLAVTGAPYAFFGVWISGFGDDFEYDVIERNDAFIEAMIKEEVKFWEEHIQANKPPMPKTYEQAAQIFHTAEQDKVKSITEDEVALAAEALKANRKYKYWKEERRRLKGEISILMEDAEELLYDDEPAFTWKNVNKKYFNELAFKEENPELWSQCARLVLDEKMLKRSIPEIYSKYVKKEIGYRRFLFKDVEIPHPEEEDSAVE